jgi:hypothetical protein
MGKYANHEDFGASAPVVYREDTTSESFLKGMSAICPPGMKPKTSRGQKFEQKTDFKASALWHRNYDQAMFAGSDIGSPDFINMQRILEGKPREIKRQPGR